jgi:hypothetical protein
LVGKWSFVRWKQEEAGAQRLLFELEFLPSDSLIQRLVWSDNDPPEWFREATTYKDSGAFFTMGTVKTRYYYQVKSGRLFFYVDEPSDSTSMVFERPVN